MKRYYAVVWILLAAGIGEARVRQRSMRFEATAAAIAATAAANGNSGVTAKGTVARDGVVAADPSVLPLGSRIRVSGAGPYSGVYVVTDTGSKVVGHKIDIYMHGTAEAKQFGKKPVIVRVLQWGQNRRNGLEVTQKKSD